MLVDSQSYIQELWSKRARARGALESAWHTYNVLCDAAAAVATNARDAIDRSPPGEEAAGIVEDRSADLTRLDDAIILSPAACLQDLAIKAEVVAYSAVDGECPRLYVAAFVADVIHFANYRGES